MNPEMRALQWSAVERVFNELRLGMGTPLPVRVGIFARNELGVELVRGALGGIEVTVSRVEKRRSPFGRRWLVVAESKPVPIDRSAIERWLDRVEAILKEQDAVLVSWAPLVPGA
jgi:hypothetical protein